MNRRKALASIAALGAAPLAARAQASDRVRRVAVLRAAPDDQVFRTHFAPFLPALREGGFVEGKNLSIEYRVQPGKSEEVLAAANELMHAKPDAILAIAAPAVVAASKATASIPIVAVDLESDPIASGFAGSLSRPGGNVTGLFLDFPQLSDKWIQRQGQKIACIEEIAFRMGYISREQLCILAEPLQKSGYGAYLLEKIAREGSQGGGR